MSVRRYVGKHQVVFENSLGYFHIPTDLELGLGLGYITKWENEKKDILVQAGEIDTSSGSGFLNDPSKHLGIGAFGLQLAHNDPAWEYWDRRWSDRVQKTSWSVGSRGWITSVLMVAHTENIIKTTFKVANKLSVHTRWRFDNHYVMLDGAVSFTKDQDYYVKEPEFAVSLGEGAKISNILTPNTSCKPYWNLQDPRKRTGRCDDPKRTKVVLAGQENIVLEAYDKVWRLLGEHAKSWPKAGDSGCMTQHGYRTEPFDNWEYVAYKSGKPYYDSLAVLFKAWEGCISGLDAWSYFRKPQTDRWYNFGMTLTVN